MNRNKQSTSNGGLVYSSEAGRMCPTCEQPAAQCRCAKGRSSSTAVPAATASKPGQKPVVRVGRETKGRKGKGVTTITGVPLSPDDLRALCKELKRKCGSGGTARPDGVIEIQGEHRDTLLQLLAAKGWQVKRSGG